MLLSSLFIFVLFALLTSASSIDDYSRRNDSLWRRRPVPTDTYRDEHGTVIVDVYGSDGRLRMSEVTFGHAVRPAAARSGPTEFHPMYSREQHIFTRFTVPVHGGMLQGRDFLLDGKQIVLTLLTWVPEHHQRRWMTFYCKPRTYQRNQYSGHIITLDHLSNDGLARHFYQNALQVLLSISVPDIPGGSWQSTSMLNNLQSVEWRKDIQER